MKIAIINKSATTGGAAIACSRLFSALNNETNMEVSLIVQHYNGPSSNIISTTNSGFKQQLNFLRFVWERLCFLPFEKSKKLRFAFSLANTGEDVSQLDAVRNADIIHIHWFNQGFLSLSDIAKLVTLGKPIVWTLHDMWAFTGGCHYTGNCTNYLQACGTCEYLRKPHINDISSKLFYKKKQVLNHSNIHFVGCSKWIADAAKSSNLLTQCSFSNIPNPIDTNKFRPLDKTVCRLKQNFPVNKKIILFGAANIRDERKGLPYLLEALAALKSSNNFDINNLHCVVFGKSKDAFALPIASSHISYVANEDSLIEMYSAADVFVLPSVQDNLPNTVVEAMACGVPVVAFNTGGLPEMIEHRHNGYLAELLNAPDIAEGIRFVLEDDTRYLMLSSHARQFAETTYAPATIARKYSDVYTNVAKHA